MPGHRAAARFGTSSTCGLLDPQPSLGQGGHLDALDPAARAVVDGTLAADALVVGSPAHKGSCAGLLDHLFDLVEPAALAGKPVLLAATDGRGLRRRQAGPARPGPRQALAPGPQAGSPRRAPARGGGPRRNPAGACRTSRRRSPASFRVAGRSARVLAARPGILLLDEPLGALDAMTRMGLQEELARLRREERMTLVLGTTTSRRLSRPRTGCWRCRGTGPAARA